jgi:hypothetical protein
VVTTSSLEQATRQTPTAISGRRRHRVCISVRSFVRAPNDGLLYFGQEAFFCHRMAFARRRIFRSRNVSRLFLVIARLSLSKIMTTLGGLCV